MNPYSDNLKREGTLNGLKGGLCYRCKMTPEAGHDRSAFCPAFADVSHAGRWLPFTTIVKAFRKWTPGTFAFKAAGRAEDPTGPRRGMHGYVGLINNDRFVCRLDTPFVPEYSLHAVDVRGAFSPDPQHPHLFMGWRRQLRLYGGKTGASVRQLFREVRANPDKVTEEIARFKVGWL